MEPTAFCLPAVLKERVRRMRKAPKRSRTRLALIAATAAELECAGYERLTIERIVDRAGVARGTFYLYFANRSDAALAVRRAFTALMRIRRPRGGSELDAFDAIQRVNRFYVACYARNAQIIAGNEALMRDRPELARSRDFLNHRWARAILRDLARRIGMPVQIANDPMALLAVRTVIAMADELLRELYANENPRLAGVATSEEDVSRVLSILWYRALYGTSPEQARGVLPAGIPARKAEC